MSAPFLQFGDRFNPDGLPDPPTSAFRDFRYYALVYFSVTGEIIDEIPLSGLPQWTQQINGSGLWTISTQIADTSFDSGGCLSKRHLRGITDGWRHSVAICWGTGSRNDYIAQAGPITARQNQAVAPGSPPLVQIGGVGFWPLLNKLMQILSTWPGLAVTKVGGADTAYTSSLQGIAVKILQNAIARQPYPLDIPAPIAGTNVRNYFGYDFVSVGQRLQELTQVENGPDILLKPYFFDNNHIHHSALIGNPTLSTSGNPLVFDYPGSIVEILASDDFSNQSTTTYEKGDGIEYASLWAKSVNPLLPNAGWPLLENANSSHADVTVQSTLQSWANGDQALTNRGTSTWSVRAKMDDPNNPFGSFDPGVTSTYNVQNHSWLEDGTYAQRLIGLQQGTQDFEYRHLVQDVTAGLAT
jgi:hypothetical protein